uniref:Uncharacterized protein n=1 Tax=Oryza sativa subsp. japonica TaxID=39947 RepID=Q75IP1_ORYSJ|nr:hypothetical protein OSJNBb0062G19.15 [Oryza sativa Japonica Group]
MRRASGVGGEAGSACAAGAAAAADETTNRPSLLPGAELLCPWLLRLSATPVDRSPPRSPAPTPADGSEAAGRADVRGAEATVAALTGSFPCRWSLTGRGTTLTPCSTPNGAVGDQALYNGFGAAGMHGAAVMQPPTFGQRWKQLPACRLRGARPPSPRSPTPAAHACFACHRCASPPSPRPSRPVEEERREENKGEKRRKGKKKEMWGHIIFSH